MGAFWSSLFIVKWSNFAKPHAAGMFIIYAVEV